MQEIDTRIPSWNLGSEILFYASGAVAVKADHRDPGVSYLACTVGKEPQPESLS
jgi:hypothetical protein